MQQQDLPCRKARRLQHVSERIQHAVVDLDWRLRDTHQVVENNTMSGQDWRSDVFAGRNLNTGFGADIPAWSLQWTDLAPGSAAHG